LLISIWASFESDLAYKSKSFTRLVILAFSAFCCQASTTGFQWYFFIAHHQFQISLYYSKRSSYSWEASATKSFCLCHDFFIGMSALLAVKKTGDKCNYHCKYSNGYYYSKQVF
jgi:hypothetical protein